MRESDLGTRVCCPVGQGTWAPGRFCTAFGEFVMTARSILTHALLAILALFAAAPAPAQGGGTSFAPIGTWEMRVGGLLEGSRVNGIAYVEFDPVGGVSGYFMSRLTAEVFDVDGTWLQTGNRFVGSIEVSIGATPVALLSMSGAARPGRSISARLTDPSGSSISLAGKPLVPMPDLSGTYTGTLRQYGVQGALSLTLTPDATGAYVVSGTLVFNGVVYDLLGYVMVTRSGSFVAYVRNLDTGFDSGLWGKIRPGASFVGVGKSLYDGSSLRVGLSRSGG